MKTKVFIDGHEGTTGLRIHERLSNRQDIELVPIADDVRKDPDAIRACMKQADIAFLCLPDGAAAEAVTLAEGCDVRLIDTSTGRRVAPGWTYGFPELSPQQAEAIAKSDRVGNPGCHASGAISILQPLTAAGIVPADYPVTAFSLTGYSGGGKKMIAQYEADTRTPDLDAPRPYGLTQSHKHLPEMQQISCLTHAPIFAPIVADYYAGMQVTIPLFRQQLNCAHPVEELTACLKAHYAGSPIVSVLDAQDVAAFGGFIPANALAGKDSMKLMVLGNDDRIELVSLFDNLGKGSSGAAIECLNLMTGAPETTGLNL